MPWHLPADLQYFKKTTLGKPIIMGRKNFEAIGRALPRRLNIILTRQEDYEAKGAVVVHRLEEAFARAKAEAAEQGEEEIFIIGGGEIYRAALPQTDRVYLTKIDLEVEGGTVFFPELPEEDWRLVSEKPQETDAKNAHPFSFNIYERKE